MPTKSSIKRRLLAIICGLLFCAVFTVCYVLTIAPIFSYAGLIYRTLPLEYWIFIIALSQIPILIMPLDLERPSDFSAWYLYLLLIMPACIIIPMTTNFTLEEIRHLPITLVLAFLLFEFVRRSRRFKIPTVRSSGKLFSFVLPIVMVILTLVLFKMGGFKINLSLSDAYERRATARELIPGGFFIGYALSFLKSVCVPIAVAIGIKHRKWYFLLLALIAVISITSLNGTKSIILIPIVIAFVVLLAMKKRAGVGFVILIACISIMFLAIVESYTVRSHVIAELLVRRAMVIPGQLTAYYYEYFSQNPHTMMADGIFGRILPIESPYLLSKARTIGAVFFGNKETNANANIWASGFADFGYLGMAAVSIIAAFLLRLVDSMAKNGRFVIACACCSAMSLTWADAALHTSLLSNGVIGLIIAVWLFPSSSTTQETPELAADNETGTEPNTITHS